MPLDRRPVAICGCGRSYSAAAWQCLPLAQANGGRGDGPFEGTELELRECLCKSHIAAALRDGVYLLHSEYVRLAREAA